MHVWNNELPKGNKLASVFRHLEELLSAGLHQSYVTTAPQYLSSHPGFSLRHLRGLRSLLAHILGDISGNFRD